jgi:hypothetical protein
MGAVGVNLSQPSIAHCDESREPRRALGFRGMKMLSEVPSGSGHGVG